MKQVLIFEKDVYQGEMDKDFYLYCIKYDLMILKYTPILFIAHIMFFFRKITRQDFLERRWGYIRRVRNLNNRIHGFSQTKSVKRAMKRWKKLASGKEVYIISEFPQQIVLLLNRGAGNILGNEYDMEKGEYTNFKTIMQRKEEINGIELISECTRRIKRISSDVFRLVILTGFALYLSLASLYFAGYIWGKEMIVSYFNIPLIAVLNILPVIFLVYILYLLSNRAWLTIAMSSCVVLGLTWINYYKLLFRNDPLMFEDLALISESKEMAGRYNIILTAEMKITLVFVLMTVILSAIILKENRKYFLTRFMCIIPLVLLFWGGVTKIYYSSDIYEKTENIALINRWSGTQMYISKGFVYPFLNSIQYSKMSEPERYESRAAKNELETYEYSDIPKNKKVNIISIMLEAYNDFSKYPQIEFEVDVYEALHNIETEAYSGELVTNIFAAGTVNTERAFLTGYTELPNFRKKTNTYAWYFREQGYTVEGSHPCYNWFYNRKNINENMGFENYYFYEDRYSEMAEGSIADDRILLPDIIEKYEENKKKGKPYFNFSVTYQNHGPYSLENEHDIKYVQKNAKYSEEEYAILNNYFAGIYSTNQQLKEMINYFTEEEEPVVVMFFGDHNPWLGDNNSVYEMLGINLDLGTEQGFYNYYDTPYVIWGNGEAKKALGNDLMGIGPKIGVNFLMNEFFDMAGYGGNEFTKVSNELKKHVDVVHELYFKEDETLTTDLVEDNKGALEKHLNLQYYWMTNYRER